MGGMGQILLLQRKRNIFKKKKKRNHQKTQLPKSWLGSSYEKTMWNPMDLHGGRTGEKYYLYY